MNVAERIVKIIKKLCNNASATKLVKNSSWIVSEKIFSMVIGVFVTAIIARYFGPEQYGQFNYALSFTELFTAVSVLGLETLTVKTLLDKTFDEGTILCTSLYLRVIGGVILTVIASVIINFIEPHDKNLHGLVLIMSFTMVVKSLEVIEYWIQAYQRAKISSVIRMSAYVISSGLKLILVLMKGNLFFYTLIYLSDAAIVGTALIIAYFNVRENKSKWRISFSYAKNIIQQSWHLILSGLMITLYMKLDQVMLGMMMPSKAEVGVYSAAVQIASMWYFVPMAVITSFKPVIMSKKNTDENGYLKSVQLLYTIITWMGIAFGIIILSCSHLIVGILFGSQYLKAASILSVSVWAGTFAMLGSARSIWLISEGLQSYTIFYTLSGFLVNLGLNFLLIPRIGGYGAAIATLCAQFTANIIVLAFFKKTKTSTVMILKSFSPKSVYGFIKLLVRSID